MNTNRIIAQVMCLQCTRKTVYTFQLPGMFLSTHSPTAVGFLPLLIPIVSAFLPEHSGCPQLLLDTNNSSHHPHLIQLCGHVNFILNFVDDTSLSTDVPFSCCGIPSRLEIFLSIEPKLPPNQEVHKNI